MAYGLAGEYHIGWFIEDQAFSQSYDLALPPPVSKLDWLHTGRLRKRENPAYERGGQGVDKEPNQTTARKPDPL